MTALTRKLLDECKKVGYTRICIGCLDKRIAACRDWPFHPGDSIFASPDVRLDGWPAIWRICDKMGLSSGCGNGQQRQYKGNLTEGNYKLK